MLEQEAAAVEVRSQEQAEAGDVEERDRRGAHRVLVQAEAGVQLMQCAAEVAAGELDALRGSGGAGGVQDQRGLVRADHHAGIVGRVRVAPGEIVEVGDQGVAGGVGSQGRGGRVDHQDAGLGVGQDGQDLGRGQAVVDGGEDRSALGRAVEDFGELRAAGADEGDAVAGGHSLALQGLGDLAGAAVEVGERRQAAGFG